MAPERYLLTGAAGFVGSHVLRHLLQQTDAQLVCPVTFRHKGVAPRVLAAVQGVPRWQDRVDLVLCDLTAPIDSVTAHRFGKIDAILNVASESHVDRSIAEPVPFIRNNVDLVLNLLEYALRANPRVFLHMSTDEVYGPAAPEQRHREWSPIAPSNPYSASKAAQEAVAFSYWRTYGVPLVITNTMNIIGEAQDPEKYVPKVVRSLLLDAPVPVHVDDAGRPGSRFYLHARNLADAWLHLLRTHKPVAYPGARLPSRFNIVGEREVDNIAMVHLIADCLRSLGRPVTPKIDPVAFHSSRPGHDLRYALSGGKLAATGWRAPVRLEDSLRRTVAWYLDNPQWLDA